MTLRIFGVGILLATKPILRRRTNLT